MRMILIGHRINAARAHQLGVVQEIFPNIEELHKG